MSLRSQLTLDFTIQNESDFDNFIITENNSELISSLKNINKQKEKFFFIWGENSAGKSHLLQAVCQNIETSVYIPLKYFYAHSPDILDGLDNLAVVCLDDVEVVLGNLFWEEKLFHFFNLIREKGNRLLITAGISPRGLTTELADLASRLSWGVVYQLHPLDDNAKAGALKIRAQSRGIILSDKILNYILQRSPRGTDNLFQVLDKLDELSLMEKRKITIPFVKSIMQW